MTARAPATPEEACAELRAGRLVGYPTETVWGLAADARNPEAVARLRAWKGREADRPLSLLVDSPAAAAAALGAPLPAAAARLAERFWPGPLTLVVPGPGGLALGVARADGAVGLRCSPHPAAAALALAARAAGLGPLTATSLNRSGEPPARRRAEAEALCAGRDAPALLAGPDAAGEAPSTVLDATGPEPVVLRAGALAEAALALAAPARCCA